MIRVRFVDTGGAETVAEAPVGARLLDVAQAVGQPLEGTCGGDMACATCHVMIDVGDLARLPAPSEEEEDLLDLVSGATRFSRLSCQIVLGMALNDLRVRIPG